MEGASKRALGFRHRRPCRRLPLPVALVGACLILLLLPCAPSASSENSSDPAMIPSANKQRTTASLATFTRVTVHVLGVFSLRGFFNMQARLYQTQGLARYKFNLRDSLMILD